MNFPDKGISPGDEFIYNPATKVKPRPDKSFMHSSPYRIRINSHGIKINDLSGSNLQRG